MKSENENIRESLASIKRELSAIKSTTNRLYYWSREFKILFLFTFVAGIIIGLVVAGFLAL